MADAAFAAAPAAFAFDAATFFAGWADPAVSAMGVVTEASVKAGEIGAAGGDIGTAGATSVPLMPGISVAPFFSGSAGCGVVASEDA
ncbi:MAG: hypothetical protein E5X10_03160 [Mesorhizobium sp.]|nr:MAG: hypothetical protein E5X10_03160 [Mesorhizobium sp.]